MRSFEFETWDSGRVVVNRDFAGILRAHNLTTFDALMRYAGGTVAKNLLRERTTTRMSLADADGIERAFYIKRHGPPPLKEYIKPLLRLTTPMLGARHEWDALIRFHAIGIPTMVPAALGISGGESFLLTQSIEGCTKLSHWMQANLNGARPAHLRQALDVIDRIAHIARTMHAAGLHHQDFYLTHLLLENGRSNANLHVIDLGRVRPHGKLGGRWIVKDLAQLNYSANMATRSDRLRFITRYLGRPLAAGDRSWLRRIARKTEAIARHSAKNRL